MSTDKETFAAIGAAIRDNRLAQELTIKDVSEKLRINQEHLIKIEAGDMGFLPMPYVRAFIRSYAEFLKMDGQAVLERWQKVVASQLSEQDKSDDEIVLEKPVPEPERKIPTAKKAFQNEIIVGASFVAVVIFILFISTFDKEKPTQKEPEKKVTEKTVAQIPFEQVLKEVNNDSMQTEPDALPGETQSPVENLNLRIDATDSVWVRVTIDDVEANEAIFTAGNSRTYTATKHFNLQIGNAGGIKLYLNEKELTPIGKSGQVRYITIDQNGIHPYRPRPAEINTQTSPDTTQVDSLAQEE